MDYVFFAFSSLCVAFSVILAFLLAVRRDAQPRALLFVLALLAGVFYYYLETRLAARNELFYYLANSLPQVVLTILLGGCLWRRRTP